jgi:hypothetical protein
VWSSGETQSGGLKKLIRADKPDVTQTILILAPVGRDAQIAVSFLRNAGITSE